MKPLPERFAMRHGDALLIVCAVVLAYANALSGPFQFDDYAVIVDARAVQSLAAWWADFGHGLRPLLKLSYWFDHALGFGAAGFHCSNVLIHLANTFLVRGFAELAARRWLPQLDERTRLRAALLAALLFALHPANTEAVTYISARSVSLMSLLFLLALAADRLRSSAPSLALALLAFVAALAVKEPAVTFAPTLWLLARFGLGREGSVTGRRWRWLPFWLLPIALALWLLPRSNYEDFLLGSLGARSIADNLLSQIAAVFDLLKLALLLRAPNIDPPLAEMHGWSLGLAAQLATLLMLLLCAFRLRRSRPWLAFGGLWFVLQLLPTNSLLPRNDLVNDRQLYFAGIGLWLIVGMECAERGWLALGWRRTMPAMLLLCGLLAVMTHRRNHDYRSEVALWHVTAEASPNKARPWNNLGYALQLEGCRQAALEAYDRALAADPEHLRARHNRQALLAVMSAGQAGPSVDSEPESCHAS